MMSLSTVSYDENLSFSASSFFFNPQFQTATRLSSIFLKSHWVYPFLISLVHEHMPVYTQYTSVGTATLDEDYSCTLYLELHTCTLHKSWYTLPPKYNFQKLCFRGITCSFLPSQCLLLPSLLLPDTPPVLISTFSLNSCWHYVFPLLFLVLESGSCVNLPIISSDALKFWQCIKT